MNRIEVTISAGRLVLKLNDITLEADAFVSKEEGLVLTNASFNKKPTLCLEIEILTVLQSYAKQYMKRVYFDTWKPTKYEKPIMEAITFDKVFVDELLMKDLFNARNTYTGMLGTFDSKECTIRKEKLGSVISNEIFTTSNALTLLDSYRLLVTSDITDIYYIYDSADTIVNFVIKLEDVWHIGISIESSEFEKVVDLITLMNDENLASISTK